MIYVSNPLEQVKAYESKINRSIKKVIKSGVFINGSETKLLKKEFSDYLGIKYCHSVANGTDALTISLKALGIGKGDEVITPSHTAVATVSAILMVGASPVFIDIDKTYYTMDENLIEKKISKKVKAIIAVHIYGNPCNIEKIIEIGKSFNVPVIEDCAQAVGSMYQNKKIGTFGMISTFSFYPTKNLGALGDAGMICTNNKSLYLLIQKISQYGWDYKRNSMIPGLNSRMDEIQAAILRIKLQKLDRDNNRRNNIAKYYDKHLSTLPIMLPKIRKDSFHSFHLYVIQTSKRKKLIEYMQKRKIFLAIHYPIPVHKQSLFKHNKKLKLEVTEFLQKRIVSLPLYPELNNNNIKKIVKELNLFYS